MLSTLALSSLLLAPAALAQSSALASIIEPITSAAAASGASVTGSMSMTSMASGSMSASASAASASSSMAANTTTTDPEAFGSIVVAALNGAGLTALAGVVGQIAMSDMGTEFLTSLQMGNKTVFAPTDDAFTTAGITNDTDVTALMNTIAYHVLNNTYTIDAINTTPVHTIARTLLNSEMYALVANRSQPLVLTKMEDSDDSFMIIQAMQNVTVNGTATPVGNLNIYVLDTVLNLPGNLSSVLTAETPSLAGLAQQVSLVEPLEMADTITLFAPNDAAVSLIMDTASTLNTTQIQGVLANHVINGTAVYSNRLQASNYTSAGGQPFTIMQNDTGSYVMSANTTAMIVRSDIPIQNGVVHIIDQVLVNTMSDEEAAGEAFTSATSAAATQTDPTAPQTATSPVNTGGDSDSDSSDGSGGTGAGSRLAPLGLTGGMVGSIVALGATVLGGAFLLI